MAPILYNVTVKVEHSIIEEWLEWMHQVHIPDVMATACFKSFQLSRLIGYEDEDGITYAVQYEASNMDLLNDYQKEHALALQSAHQEKFRGKYVAFRSLLEVIQRG